MNTTNNAPQLTRICIACPQNKNCPPACKFGFCPKMEQKPKKSLLVNSKGLLVAMYGN